MGKRVFAALFVSLIVVILILTYLSNYSSPPPAPPRVTRAQETAVVKRLRSDIEHPKPAARIPSSAPKTSPASPNGAISVSFPQDDVNTLLATSSSVRRQLIAVGIAAAQVAFVNPNRVRVDVWSDNQGTKREMQVEGALTPDGSGGIQFHTDSSRLGLLPLPSGITASQMDRRVDKLIRHLVANLPLRVDAISATNGRLTLTGPKK